MWGEMIYHDVASATGFLFLYLLHGLRGNAKISDWTGVRQRAQQIRNWLRLFSQRKDFASNVRFCCSRGHWRPRWRFEGEGLRVVMPREPWDAKPCELCFFVRIWRLLQNIACGRRVESDHLSSPWVFFIKASRNCCLWTNDAWECVHCAR